MSILEELPGVQLIFSTRMPSQYAIDVAERVNVISDEGELEALIEDIPKKVGCSWCSRCSFFREHHYHSDQCREANPEGHRSDCEIHCRELPPVDEHDSEDHEEQPDQESEQIVEQPAIETYGHPIGLSADAARLLLSLSGSMLGMKVRFTKNSIRLKFYRQPPIIENTAKSHELELQRLREEHEYRTMTEEDKIKYKQFRKQLKKEQREEKKALKAQLREEKKLHREEIEKLKRELFPEGKKKFRLFKKKSKNREETPIEIGLPELVSSSRDSVDIRTSIRPASGELEKLIATSPIVFESSSSIESETDSDSVSEDDDYVTVETLDCVERLLNRQDQLSQKKSTVLPE